ncbi:MAG: zinc ribbon domain-containing protein [Gammaproteobacteria bacterium]
MSTSGDIGILAIGGYTPAWRIRRETIAAAMDWAVPALKGMAKGDRSVANWDEDAVTMAVEAGRRCLEGRERSTVTGVSLAGTTLPFADRSNSGILADALNLDEHIRTEDTGGSRRAATSALQRLLRQPENEGSTLLTASDCRETQPGSVQEMQYGHGAAAVLIGAGNVLARCLGSASIHRDLVDQYRAHEVDYDYALEQRWVQEEGYLKVVPAAVETALENAEIGVEAVHHLIIPAPAAVATKLAAKMNMPDVVIADSLAGQVGDAGAAQPLLMLAMTLANAEPGQTILLVGFGQGADACVLQTTEAVSDCNHDVVTPGRRLDNYVRFLALRRQLNPDFGIRAERDNRTALSTYYRKRRDITGFVGGRCGKCNTLQFPRSNTCIHCREMQTQESESLAELSGTVKSFTEDWLAYTPSPPLVYGNVTFPDGANVLMEFTDTVPGEVEVGAEVRMMFRIKDFDDHRNFRRYFWKSVLTGEAKHG